MIKHLFVFGLMFNLGCNTSKESQKTEDTASFLNFSKNSLDYHSTPKDAKDRSGLMFSDQGAWFAYGQPKESKASIGFSGPFLMTQQNGVWLSASFMGATIKVDDTFEPLTTESSHSYASHLENYYSSKRLSIQDLLVLKTGTRL